MLDIWLMNVADLNHLLKFYTSSLIIVYQVTRWYCNREDKLVSNLARKYTGSTIFTVCIVYDYLLTFSHTLYWENIWKPRRVRVIMESQCIRKVVLFVGLSQFDFSWANFCFLEPLANASASPVRTRIECDWFKQKCLFHNQTKYNVYSLLSAAAAKVSTCFVL